MKYCLKTWFYKFCYGCRW
ncbi:hypothetical protein CFP56_025865 [Quercus suber]|uniref:Uncharacterized protein n=1 Tax=Quercus suber TaxID=58331 RepID=A0AAW0K2A3_QUESU